MDPFSPVTNVCIVRISGPTLVGAINLYSGKRVVQLEYEAYIPMALKQLEQICSAIREKWPVCKIAIVHRTG